MKLHNEYAIYARIGPYGSRVITIRDRNVSQRVDYNELCELTVIKLPNEVVNSSKRRSQISSYVITFAICFKRLAMMTCFMLQVIKKSKSEISDIYNVPKEGVPCMFWCKVIRVRTHTTLAHLIINKDRPA